MRPRFRPIGLIGRDSFEITFDCQAKELEVVHHSPQIVYRLNQATREYESPNLYWSFCGYRPKLSECVVHFGDAVDDC